jgi:hypothetical protein
MKTAYGFAVVASLVLTSCSNQAPAPAAPAAAAPATTATNESDARDDHRPALAEITSKTLLLPPGTQISVRNDELIDSGRTSEGQTYAARVTRDVRDSAGDVAIPRGANAVIIIRSASKGGKVRGASDLDMDLASVSVEGTRYQLSTVDLIEKGRDGVGANKRTGEITGGGAAIGAIIGAIAGGGKGAAIGGGAGAGAGALTQILTKGTIKVPAESVLTFRLDAPLRIVEAQ